MSGIFRFCGLAFYNHDQNHGIYVHVPEWHPERKYPYHLHYSRDFHHKPDYHYLECLLR